MNWALGREKVEASGNYTYVYIMVNVDNRSRWSPATLDYPSLHPAVGVGVADMSFIPPPTDPLKRNISDDAAALFVGRLLLSLCSTSSLLEAFHARNESD
jgi:hypothetical protein